MIPIQQGYKGVEPYYIDISDLPLSMSDSVQDDLHSEVHVHEMDNDQC
jgi:hypothetical protein